MTVGRILANGEDKGSGFVLATPHSTTTRVVLTARHVVSDQEPSSLHFLTEDKRRIPVERMEQDDDLDIAVLHLCEDVAEGLAVGHAVEKGSWQVRAQPRGNDPKLTGTINAIRRHHVTPSRHEIDVLQLQVNQTLGDYKGYSGSAVMLDSPSGGVIGILTEQLLLRLPTPTGQPRPATNVLYAIPIQDVLDRFGLEPLLAASSRGRLSGLRRRVVPLLVGILGIALMCVISLFPFFPPIINRIAENAMDFSSASPLPSLFLFAATGLFESLPLLLGTVSGPLTGLVVGISGVVLSSFLLNPVATRYYPTKGPTIHDLLNLQLSWFRFLILGSILMGLAAFFTGLIPRHPQNNRLRKRAITGIVSLLIAAAVYEVFAQLFHQPVQAPSALSPLLDLYGPPSLLPGPAELYPFLLVLPGILLFPLLLLIYNKLGTSRNNRQKKARVIQKLIFATLILVTILLIIFPVRSYFVDSGTPSTHLQNQELPLIIPITSPCATCQALYLDATVESITLSTDGTESSWSITFTNRGACIKNIFTSTSITLADAFFNVYRAGHFPGEDSMETIDHQKPFHLDLSYHIVPRPGQHLRLTISVMPVPCSGNAPSPEQYVSVSNVLLFQ